MSMLELSAAAALSIFLTCAFFFIAYGACYLIVYGLISLITKIRKKVKEGTDGKGNAGDEKNFDDRYKT